MRQLTIILLSAIVLIAAGCLPKTALVEPQRQLPVPPTSLTALTAETSARARIAGVELSPTTELQFGAALDLKSDKELL